MLFGFRFNDATFFVPCASGLQMSVNFAELGIFIVLLL